MSSNTNKQEIRILTRGAYDVQKLRIQMGNRVVANFRVKLGQAPSTPETELDDVGKEVLDKLRASYKKITDGVVRIPSGSKFKGDEIISTYTEFALVAEYLALEKVEDDHFNRLKKVVEEHPIWEAFLLGVKGIGPAMAGVLISELDPYEARTISCFWAYAGLDVCDDGRGRSRRQEHLVERTYTNRSGEEATRLGISFNPFLKTKLIGVCGSSFLRAGGKYAGIYRDYKYRLENHVKYGIANDEARKAEMGALYAPKAHRHNMAIRYACKIFLQDLWLKWREIEGLELTEPYAVAKLGYRPHGSDPSVDSVEEDAA